MEAQIAQFTNRGMNQDISVSKASNEFAFRNHNIRITAVNDNTLLSVTNEKGPSLLDIDIEFTVIPNKIVVDRGIITAQNNVFSDVEITIFTAVSGTINVTIPKGEKSVKYDILPDEDVDDWWIESPNPTYDDRFFYYQENNYIPVVVHSNTINGKYLGSAIINDKIVIFTHSEEDESDRIYIISYEDGKFIGELKYIGNLGFNEIESVETLPYYESEDVQKVYWVDGIHQPRVINIMADNIVDNLNTQFDFVPTVNKFPRVTIEKQYQGSGLFPAGTVQYFISYYNKYGAETGIVWASDINYITNDNKGASPEDVIVCNFNLNIDNIDTSYEYLRIYSSIRTSVNSTPSVKIVKDLRINNQSNILFTDTNTSGESIDFSHLLFLKTSSFTASTLSEKHNTLFLGNIDVNGPVINSKIVELFNIDKEDLLDSRFIEFKQKTISNDYQLKQSEANIKTFKFGEIYRFGIQFQDSNAVWTSPIWIGDKKCNIRPESNSTYIKVPYADVVISSEYAAKISEYYSNFRLLIAETDFTNRSILAQGVVTPSVFNLANRVNNNGPYSIASWITRPNNSNIVSTHLASLGNKTTEYVKGCEIQNSIIKAPVATPKKGYVISFYYNAAESAMYINIYNTKGTYSGSIESVSVSYISELNNTKIIEDVNPEEVYKDLYTYITNIVPNGMDNLSENSYLKFLEDCGDLQNKYYFDYFSIDGTNNCWYSAFFSGGNSIEENITKSGCSTNPNIYGAYTYLDEDVLNPIVGFDNDYYVDSSIVNFFSPEIEDNESLFNTNLKFRITGIIPVTSIISDVNLEVGTKGNSNESGVIKSYTTSSLWANAPLYRDSKQDSEGSYNSKNIVDYIVYLWNKKGSLVGDLGDNNRNIYAELKHKVIANKKISDYVVPITDDIVYDIIPTTFNSDDIISKTLKVDNNNKIYQGNYESLLATSPNDLYKMMVKSSYEDRKTLSSGVEQYDPVSIKYKTTPHIVFELRSNGYKHILPHIKDEDAWSFSKVYKNYSDFSSLPWGEMAQNYRQKTINSIDENINYPYLFIGEVFRDIDRDTLYGGTDEYSFESIKWIPASDSTPISTNGFSNSYGDTYYQKWDCLTSYPYTEEDLNSVVDITTFMVESHINVEGRYDANKNSSNILNVRRNNFNKFNTAYNQSNNLFSYSILNDLKQSKYANQVIFSLTKEPTSDIDTWTNIPLTSAFNLNNLYGKLNKIINFNDTLITFQDKAISAINFNNRTALSTESGVPIEIANSGKVDGYTVISSAVGCKNKHSICQTSSGVYFIDDLNKSLFRFNKEGLNNISATGMSQWFKNNLTEKEYLFYDAITHDVYVVNNSDCLVYNEDLQSFTSFMDYQGMDNLFNINGHSLALKTEGTLSLYKMFGGKYNTTFDSNEHKGYFVEYKVNPEPLSDKIFGSVEYIADCIPNDVDIDNVGLSSDYPFDRLDVWNEYQKGSTTIKDRFKYPNFERKFRIWRVDIPRDKSNYRDRIRNPWAYIRLSKMPTSDNKTVFHSLLVKYYK
jgi:hypothetical protein